MSASADAPRWVSPPSTYPTRLRPNSASVQAPGQNAFLGVQAVLGLVEHNRMRPIDHLVRDFLAAMRRQAMHENRARIGQCHQTGVDLIALEQVVAALAD